MTRIYSDIQGYLLITEGDTTELHIIDWNGNKYHPNLIVPNKLAIEKLRDYLNTVLKTKGEKEKQK